MRRILAGAVVAPAILFGCQTTVEMYQPDGKTLASRTKVGIAHEVRLPNGVTVTTSDSVVTASQAVVLKGLEIGGAALAQEALKAAGEAAKGTPEPSTGGAP